MNDIENRVIDLPVRKEWYNRIAAGERTEYYREIKPFWVQRLFERVVKQTTNEGETCYVAKKIPMRHLEQLSRKELLQEIFSPDNRPIAYNLVRFRKGFGDETMLYELKGISLGRGRAEWGAPDEETFVFKIGVRVYG